MSRVLLVFALPAALALAGCDRLRACPPCECKCECDADGTTGGVASPDDPANAGSGNSAGELGELVASANRKLAHGDGPGCLADLDQVKALDPKLDTQMLLVRAQCQMAAGECQVGKQAIADYYVREQAFTRERAEQMAESMASMRCQGGDASERDQLLAAYYHLSDGAYMNKRDVGFCREHVATIEALAPKVAPRDVEDTQITGGRQALFHTGAMCFARAGDCEAAFEHYRRFFPPDSLSAIQDPAMREKVVRDGFDSSIALCQQQP